MSVIPNELQSLHLSFWMAHAAQYDMSTQKGCGEYTESFIRHAQSNGYPKVGHLKKNPSQTQWNGHAIDAFLYNEPDPTLLRSVDFIGSAESDNAQPSWSIDEPRYTSADWSALPPNDSSGGTKLVPWFPYDENGFQRLKNMLAHDYGRRPQGADFDVSVWAGRYFHNAYMGPEGIPLGEDAALHKVKPELCAALGIPMDNYYGE